MNQHPAGQPLRLPGGIGRGRHSRLISFGLWQAGPQVRQGFSEVPEAQYGGRGEALRGVKRHCYSGEWSVINGCSV